jgi:hypothetical protein
VGTYTLYPHEMSYISISHGISVMMRWESAQEEHVCSNADIRRYTGYINVVIACEGSCPYRAGK